MYKNYLKYEIISKAKYLLVFLFPGLIAYLSYILATNNSSPIAQGITGWIFPLSCLITYFGVFGLIIAFSISFGKTLYGKSGYLTGMLPIRKSLIFITKIVIDFLIIIGGVLFLLLAMIPLVINYAAISFPEVASFLSLYNDFLGNGVFIFTLIIGSLTGLAQIYFSISLANTPKFQRKAVATGIVSYIAMYFIMQMASAIAVIPATIINSDSFSSSNDVEAISAAFGAMGTVMTFVNIMSAIFLVIFTVYSFLAYKKWSGPK